MVHLKGRQNVQKSDLEQRASIIKKKIIVFTIFFWIFKFLSQIIYKYTCVLLHFILCTYSAYCHQNLQCKDFIFSINIDKLHTII